MQVPLAILWPQLFALSLWSVYKTAICMTVESSVIIHPHGVKRMHHTVSTGDKSKVTELTRAWVLSLVGCWKVFIYHVYHCLSMWWMWLNAMTASLQHWQTFCNKELVVVESTRHSGERRKQTTQRASWRHHELTKSFQSPRLLSEARPSAWISHHGTGQNIFS